MPDSGDRYRADLIEFAVGQETTYGTAVPCISQIGLINNGVTLADPTYEWQPFFGIGVDSRNMTYPIQGRQVLQGSISNVMYCHDVSRFILYNTLGSVMGDAAAQTAFEAFMMGTHTVQEALVQPSFTIGARFRGVGGAGSTGVESGTTFARRYTGCKITRCTINLNEGQPVTVSFDYIAQDIQTSGVGTSAINPKDSAIEVTDVVMMPISEQPYFFSNAKLEFAGTEFARFRSLSIVIDNQLDPRYYLEDSAVGGNSIDGRQTLAEILEGRRTISIRGQLDLDDVGTDAYFLNHLLRQGDVSPDSGSRVGEGILGVTLNVTLERHGGDMTQIRMPAEGTPGLQEVGLVLRSAAHNIPAPPAIHIPVDIEGFVASIDVNIIDA